MISNYAIFTKSGKLNLKNLNPYTYCTHHISQHITANNPLVAYANVSFYALSNACQRIFLSQCANFPFFSMLEQAALGFCCGFFLTPYLQQLLDKDHFLAELQNQQTTSEKGSQRTTSQGFPCQNRVSVLDFASLVAHTCLLVPQYLLSLTEQTN